MDTIGENVKRLRDALGLTQVELAARVGVSQSMIAMIERGKRIPSVHALVTLAQALEVSVDALLGAAEDVS